jgi:hypothetical protein
MKSNLIKLVMATVLVASLSGCGGGALMALSAVGGGVSIAKDVFDIDVDIHTLLGQPKPAPISPVTAVTHPQYLVQTPPQ